MYKLEYKELARKTEVVRKQIPNVPALAEELLSIKAEYDAIVAHEKELSLNLEDPANI
eukprot:CAMPEP_0201284670 /NCGR_PEP_ID=MMETSP1317-20130820/81007_1 /ASSEMBLY_ACC=CAM_ASM_000770 /TAXON_ID=187299 /ORGANISM="Undescribed Undescribed, Strain Undescribed" /LENGTH=57 /DNA_ID=CAMNT_0047605747 /DNA_START=845 /DNA_END=1018 /DNA_ORIENTATION=+